MLLKFVDREEELKELENLYTQPGAQFILIYGRRRIGKTELIKRFISDKRNFYFLAKKEPIEIELNRMVRNFSRKFNIFMEARTLEDFFERVVDFGKIVFVIDEFPYWVDEDSSIPSKFQYIWDEILKDSEIMLVLLGSSISTMESLMSYKNPLYGRRTAQIKLTQIPFFSLKDAFPEYSWDDLVKVYGCIGGIPAYFQYFDTRYSVEENIERNFYRKVSILYEDAERLLKDELREPINYLNILRAINEGKTKLTEISNETKIAITNLPKYLKTLETLDLIYKEFPIDATRKSRRGIYRVKDMYYRFWLRFVYPYRDDIEIGTIKFSDLSEEFNSYLGEVFEEVAKHFLIRMNRTEKLPFNFTRLGRWWERNVEVDLIVLNSKKGVAGFFEVKWRNMDLRDAKRALLELERKIENIKIKREKEYLGIIAKRISDKDRLKEEGLLVFDLDDFENTLH